jgi:hypothetical protein
MKRLLTAALFALSSTVFAATLNPIQLLNPAGSTAGQTIVSTGPSSAPAWAPLSGLAGTLAIANGGTGATSAASARTNLGVAATTGATFTGNIIFNYPTPTTTLGVTWQSNGSSRWILQNDGTAETGSNAGSNLVLVSRTDAGAFLSQALVVNRASGLVQVAALNSSGLITPTTTVGIKGTNTNDSAQAGSWGEYQTNSTAGTSMTTVTAVACTSVSLTAGDWDVSGTVSYRPAGTTTVAALSAGINGTVANTTGNNGLFTTTVIQGGYQTGQVQQISTPIVRESLASTTTIFLVGYASFGTSTMTCDGIIRARRIR